jgi:hypothetical protein
MEEYWIGVKIMINFVPTSWKSNLIWVASTPVYSPFTVLQNIAHCTVKYMQSLILYSIIKIHSDVNNTPSCTVKVALYKNKLLRHIALLNFNSATSAILSEKSTDEVKLFHRSLVCTFGLADNVVFWNLFICLNFFYGWLATQPSLCPLCCKTEQTMQF